MKALLALSLKYGRRQSVMLGLVFGLLLLDIGFNVLTPWPLKLIVDNVLAGEPLPDAAAWLGFLPGATSAGNMLAWLVSGILLLFISRQLIKIITNYLRTGIFTQIKLNLASDVFMHLQRLSMNFYSNQKTGDLVRRVINDTDFIRTFITKVILPTFISVATLLAMLWIMWQLQPLLSLLALVVAIPLPFLIKSLTPRMSEQAHAHYAAEGALMSVAEQAITSLPVVQAFGREDYEDERFRKVSTRAVQTHLKFTLSELKFSVSVGAIMALGTAAMMILGGFQVYSGQLSLGSLLVFLAYLASIYQIMEALTNLSVAFANSKGQAQRIFQLLEAKEEVPETPNAHPFRKRHETRGIAVVFENVSFGYEPQRPVLQDITLSVPAGACIALVGATGAGKTTLASLIPRFFDPWEGRVLFDDTDIRDLQLHSLREQIALVLQEPFLLPMTIAENIAYGRPHADREEIVAAAQAANADEFINRLPDAYDTVIGERGATLSGGQRQRLSIARALLKDAPILILDEPTSALDTKTETLILEALERLMVNRTTFIIAHRLSTIRNADTIVVLKDGRIVEQGPQHELIKAGKDYWKLLNSAHPLSAERQ